MHLGRTGRFPREPFFGEAGFESGVVPSDVLGGLGGSGGVPFFNVYVEDAKSSVRSLLVRFIEDLVGWVHRSQHQSMDAS